MIYDLVDLVRMREYATPPRLFKQNIYFDLKPATAGDVFQVIPVLAGDVVLAAWAEVVTACTADATIDLGYGSDVDYFGNGLLVSSAGHCRSVISGTLTWNLPEIEHGIEETNEVEIVGARVGDIVTIGGINDIADISISGEVFRDDLVSVRATNNTGGTLDLLQSQTLEVIVNKAPQMASPLVFASADTIDVVANEAITSGVLRVSAVILRK